jgi:hypothetical protein
MANDPNRPGVSGQDHTDPSSNPHSDLAKILAAIHGIGTRLGILEQRFEYLDRDVMRAIESPSVPNTLERLDGEDPEPPVPLVPGLALRSDGKVLLSVAYLKGAEFEGRERWEGVVLSVAEAWDAIDAVSDGCDDAASRVAGRVLWKGKKEGGSNE